MKLIKSKVIFMYWLQFRIITLYKGIKYLNYHLYFTLLRSCLHFYRVLSEWGLTFLVKKSQHALFLHRK